MACSRRRFDAGGLVAALACGTLVTVAMALMALATALYVGALAVNASSLAAGDNGPFGVPSVGISIGIQLVVMLGAASLAAVSTRRGWQALGVQRPIARRRFHLGSLAWGS